MRHTSRGPRSLGATAALSVLLLAAACGKDDKTDSIPLTGNPPTTIPETTVPPVTEGTFPTSIEAANGTVEIAARPEKIVSLSPTATEMLFAIDAGTQVVAVDAASDYPANAPVTDLSAADPDVAAIVSRQPDLVLVETDAAIEALTQRGLTVALFPQATTFDDSYAEIEQLGKATGQVSAATQLVETMRTKVQKIVDRVAQTFAPVPVYHEADADQHTVAPASFMGHLYQLAGLANIAADEDAAGTARSFPADRVISANPDWIFLGYDDTGAVDTVKARAGWDQIKAVQNNRVIALDPGLATRWGPRAVDLLDRIVETTAPS